FRFAPARMQNPFRVAVRLRAAHEDQVASGPEWRAVVAGRHRPIVWIMGILAVDDVGHAPERHHDLLVVDDALQQPVGNVLAGIPQGGTILHQPTSWISGTFEQPTPWSIQRTT